MSFWLHESQCTLWLRGFSQKTWLLMTLCSSIAVISMVVLYKNRYRAQQVVQELVLSKALNESQPKKTKASPKRTPLRKPLNKKALPETLQFFSKAGFYLCAVEQLLMPRSKKVIGYVVRVTGSFEKLMKFLNFVSSLPQGKIIHVLAVERVNEEVVAIEFLIKGAEK